MAKVQMKVSGVTEGLTSTIHAGTHTLQNKQKSASGEKRKMR